MSAAVNLPDLLARCAGEASLLCLDGGTSGWSLIALPETALPLASVTDLPAIDEGSAEQSGTGWPGMISGGAVVQLDYEFAVGSGAFPLAGPQRRGWLWPLRSWLSLGPQGERLFGGDTAPLQRLLAGPAASLPDLQLKAAPQPAWSAAEHASAVETIVAHIAAGDCFQANVTMPFEADIASAEHADLALWAALRARSPAPYGCFLRHDGRTVISHSPECFLRSDGNRVLSEPIKGTRRRLAGQEDALRQELLNSAKDRAELAMIIDLVRNDLGRIAAPGTVRVEHDAQVMDLDYVHHLVGIISTQVSPEMRHGDLLSAAFPPGSITGAPKIKAMELLASLESAPRGPYCGSFGWLGSGHRCALAVAIRTMVLSGSRVRFDAGGGIVADSTPAEEWAEVQAKASAMQAALGQADGAAREGL